MAEERGITIPRLLELARLDSDIAEERFDEAAVATHLGEDGLKALNQRQRARGGKRRRVPSRRISHESAPARGTS